MPDDEVKILYEPGSVHLKWSRMVIKADNINKGLVSWYRQRDVSC